MVPLSENLQDYLEAIYNLVKAKNVARVTDIARMLEVTKSSASIAIKNLEEQGYIAHDKYSYATLTEKGYRQAELIVRRHRILTMFYNHILHIDPKEAERLACRMEHIVDRQVVERIIAFMHYIAKAPKAVQNYINGFDVSAFPAHQAQDEQDITRNYTTLMDLQPGESGRIIRVKGKGEFHKRLADLGILKGKVVKVERVAPLGDPIYLVVDNTRLSIRKEDAYAIWLLKTAPTDGDA